MLPFIEQIVNAIHQWRGVTPDLEQGMCNDETYKLASSLAVELGTETYVFSRPEPVWSVIKPCESWVVENCYGARCLVTTEIVILDVDIVLLKDCCIRECNSEKASGLREAEKTRLANILNRYELPFRLYETACGHRIIIQQRNNGPERIPKEMYDKLTTELKVDPKYLRISQEQGNWRARLDTKPWRTDGECLMGGSILGNEPDIETDGCTRVLIARLVAWGRQGVEGLPGADVVYQHDRATGAGCSGNDDWLLA